MIHSENDSLVSRAVAKLDETPPQAGDTNDNVRLWLTDARYEEFARQVAQHVLEQRWSELEQAFWKTIPFGTAGRRGRMYPIGSNAINDK